MQCDRCGAAVHPDDAFCVECGADLSGREPTRSDRRERTESRTRPRSGVGQSDRGRDRPPDATGRHDRTGRHGGIAQSRAAAVDVECPHCGVRPIQEVAKGYRITGLLLLYRFGSYRYVGCHSCVGSKLRGLAGKNLLFGWWSFPGIVLTPFLVVYDLFRSVRNRGPNESRTHFLDGAGVHYEFLADANQFDPARHSPIELYLRATVHLACAVARADDPIRESERAAIRETSSDQSNFIHVPSRSR